MTVQHTETGLGLPSVLFIVFLILKLTGVITWSWWWVTAPLWISFVVFVAIFVTMLLFLFLAALVR